MNNINSMSNMIHMSNMKSMNNIKSVNKSVNICGQYLILCDSVSLYDMIIIQNEMAIIT